MKLVQLSTTFKTIQSSPPPLTTKMTSPKTEFTKIFTSSYLLPTSSSSKSQEETFPPVLTENSLLSSPPPSSESFFSTTSVIISESMADLIHIYDDTFPDLQQYHNFVNR